MPSRSKAVRDCQLVCYELNVEDDGLDVEDDEHAGARSDRLPGSADGDDVLTTATTAFTSRHSFLKNRNFLSFE